MMRLCHLLQGVRAALAETCMASHTCCSYKFSTNCQRRNLHSESQAKPVGGITRSKYELFVQPDIQEILTKLTSTKPKDVLPNIAKFKKLPEITLMTKEQLLQAQEQASEYALEMIQMPPVLPEREDIHKVLSADKELEGFSTSSFVFIDITVGLPERERNIVVRTPDGTLSIGSWETRDRILEAYYPRKGRRIKAAPMFSGQYLQKLMDKEQYRYLLDAACWQYEPDHPNFIKITQTVYEDCDINHTYDELLSTRHYGPMIFYFVLHKRITNIFKHLMKKSRVDDCIDITKLYSIVWNLEVLPVPSIDQSTAEKMTYIKEFLEREQISNSDLLHDMNIVLMRESATSDNSISQGSGTDSVSSSVSDSSSSSVSDSGSSSDSESGSSSDSDSSSSSVSDSGSSSDSDSSSSSDSDSSSSSDSDSGSSSDSDSGSSSDSDSGSDSDSNDDINKNDSNVRGS